MKKRNFCFCKKSILFIDHHDSENDDGDGWHLVGTFKTTTADVKQYYVVPSKINIDNYVSLLFSKENSFMNLFL